MLVIKCEGIHILFSYSDRGNIHMKTIITAFWSSSYEPLWKGSNSTIYATKNLELQNRYLSIRKGKTLLSGT